jgi:hypothetical protein
MSLIAPKRQMSVGHEALGDQDKPSDLLRRSYGADFWPMTFILIVVVVASLVALSRIAELF